MKAAFDRFPPTIQKRLLVLRELILATAAKTPGVGVLEETLKWGEPAYLTSQSKSGSTIRLGWKKASPDEYAMYFNCNTTLIDTYRTIFPELKYEGNRAIVFDVRARVPKRTLGRCIEMALTYHRTGRADNARK